MRDEVQEASYVHVGLTSSGEDSPFHSPPSSYEYDFLSQLGNDTVTAREVATVLAAFLVGPQGQLLSSR